MAAPPTHVPTLGGEGSMGWSSVPCPWASQAVSPPQWGGCPRLHLCDDLAVLRHVDLHGHAVRGAPQDVDRGRLRGRKNPWVPAPCPALGQHPGVHILGQGLGGVAGVLAAGLELPSLGPGCAVGAGHPCHSLLHAPTPAGPPGWRGGTPLPRPRGPSLGPQSCPRDPCDTLGPAHGTLDLPRGTPSCP